MPACQKWKLYNQGLCMQVMSSYVQELHKQELAPGKDNKLDDSLNLLWDRTPVSMARSEVSLAHELLCEGLNKNCKRDVLGHPWNGQQTEPGCACRVAGMQPLAWAKAVSSANPEWTQRKWTQMNC